jgi:hypothetical protein
MEDTTAMRVTVNLPDLDRIPRPALSTKQWAVVGSAAVLGVTEVVSAPIAVLVGAAPFLDRYLLHNGSTGGRRTAGRRASATTATAASTRRTRKAGSRTSTRRSSPTRTSTRRGRPATGTTGAGTTSAE